MTIPPVRLDKLLGRLGVASRSQCRDILRAGRVQVNGETRTDGAFIVPQGASVTLDGRPLDTRLTRHVMLYKPAGVLTAREDGKQQTVMELLPPEYAAMGCMPVGRLDKDTTGLLLLTTDGELAHRLNRDTRAEEDGLQFVVREAYPLEQGIATFAKGLVVALRYEDPKLAERAERLQALGRRFPGTLPLKIDLSYADGRHVAIDLPDGVSATGEFLAALGDVVAREHYRLDVRPEIFAEPPERKPWEKKK